MNADAHDLARAAERVEARLSASPTRPLPSGSVPSLPAVATAPGELPTRWTGVLAVEGMPTGDGRVIEPGALDLSLVPLPLRYAPADFGGHEGAVVVGTIDTATRDRSGRIIGAGTFDLGSDQGREAARLVAGGILQGVSVDLDDLDGDARPLQSGGILDAITAARLRAATLVAIPAFSEARIAASGYRTPTADELATLDRLAVQLRDRKDAASARAVAALAAIPKPSPSPRQSGRGGEAAPAPVSSPTLRRGGRGAALPLTLADLGLGELDADDLGLIAAMTGGLDPELTRATAASLATEGGAEQLGLGRWPKLRPPTPPRRGRSDVERIGKPRHGEQRPGHDPKAGKRGTTPRRR